MDSQSDQWFWVIFALVVGLMLYSIVTKGWKGSLFNARISESYDKIAQAGGGLMRGHIRVHVLETTPQRNIGIEIVWTSFLSWQMMPVKLSQDAARRLINDLSAAIESA